MITPLGWLKVVERSMRCGETIGFTITRSSTPLAQAELAPPRFRSAAMTHAHIPYLAGSVIAEIYIVNPDMEGVAGVFSMLYCLQTHATTGGAHPTTLETNAAIGVR